LFVAAKTETTFYPRTETNEAARIAISQKINKIAGFLAIPGKLNT
jgi:hypothetical protein